jgi:hypothetical protein
VPARSPANYSYVFADGPFTLREDLAAIFPRLAARPIYLKVISPEEKKGDAA